MPDASEPIDVHAARAQLDALNAAPPRPAGHDTFAHGGVIAAPAEPTGGPARAVSQEWLDAAANIVADHLPHVPDREVAEVAQRAVTALVPLLLSADANAHARGAREARDASPEPSTAERRNGVPSGDSLRDRLVRAANTHYGTDSVHALIVDALMPTIDAAMTARQEPDPQTGTYALALMRSTLLGTPYPDGTGLFGVDVTNAVCDALAPQVRRMLADADARVERAIDGTRAACYAGAADDPGNPDVPPTNAQWLRRLFDLPESQRLACASYLAAAGQTAARCSQEKHPATLARLQDDVDAARQATADADAVHVAAVREARRVSAERAWDNAADSLADPTEAANLRAGNPYRDSEPEPAPVYCPECVQGKPQNCAGTALDERTDDFVTCATQAATQAAQKAAE